MSLKSQIEADLAVAMKERREPDRTVLRSLVAALQNERIAAGAELDEAKETAVVGKQLKQREEAAVAYDSRPELAERERAEAAIIKRYLPETLPEAEVEAAIDAAIAESGASGPGDLGKVMGLLKDKLAGRADLGAVSGKVKAKLG